MSTIQWVFSGVGVFAIAMLFKIFFKSGKKKPNGENMINDSTLINRNSGNVLINKDVTTTNTNSNNIQIIKHQTQHLYQAKQDVAETIIVTNITPLEIKDAIENVPLYQHDTIGENYVGLNIDWPLKLFSIFESKKSIEVTFTYVGIFPGIKIETTIENHPFFKIAKKEDKFQVAGKITECDKYSIRLQIRSIKEIN
ncbi:MAG TPA: hypothetical protein VIH86_00805 [Puia sp.]